VTAMAGVCAIDTRCCPHSNSVPQLTRGRAAARTVVTQRSLSQDHLVIFTSSRRSINQTTNVFVANLPPHVTEQSLGHFFARIGPVGSVCFPMRASQQP
jgi:hypothetical protein